MQKTLAKSIVALLLILALCLGMAWVLFPAHSNVAQAAVTEWDNPYTGSYYDNLNEDKSGSAFRTDLAKLITDTHKSYTTYDGLAEVYKTTDINPQTGKLIWFYTGTEVNFSGFGGAVGATNREHVWPKDDGGAFSATSGPGSDAHHLRPTETNLNSIRGSLQFGEVPQTTSNIAKQNQQTSYGNSAYGADALCYRANGYFYPAKGFRGQTARILMYVQTRWGDANNLHFVLGQGSSKTIGDIETLFKWHLEEPPTELEMYRNEEVYKIQGNRNPFIDHPEYAAKIYCYNGENYNSNLLNVLATVGDPYDNSNTEPLTSLSFAQSQMTLTAGQQTTLTPVKNPQNAKVRYTWTSSNTTVAEVSGGGIVTAKKAGTAVITAKDAETNISASVTINVKDIVSIAISGTPTKLEYTEGDLFDPTGLVVTATFSDNSTDTVPLDSCTWTDGTTGSPDLSQGTTTVNCHLGSLTQTVTGITVAAYEGGGTETITIDSFNERKAYCVQNWTTGTISGIAFIYTSGGDSNNWLQFNTGKGGCYLASNTPAPGGIKSITVKLNKKTSGTTKDWELLTSDTPYTAPSSGDYPTTGTRQGQKGVSQDGVTWELTGSPKYFTLNYKSTGVCYLASITIEYGAGGGSDPTPPTPPVIDPDLHPEFVPFATAVQQVAVSTTQADIRASINNALAEYHNLTAEQQQDATVAATYAQLQQAIEDYNQRVAAQNKEMQLAIKTALSGFYGTTVTVALAVAALSVIKRRFF